MDRLTVHGARGSHSVSSPLFCRYGGHTPCVSMETDRGLIILDAGSGIAALSDRLIARRTIPPMTLLFTHFHLDHLMGLTAFKPLFKKGVRMTLMAASTVARNWPRALKTLFHEPFWPVNPLNSGARVRIRPLPAASRQPLSLYGIQIFWCPIWHPNGCVSYKLKTPRRVIVLASDREMGRKDLDRRFIAFCRGADLLLHDSQFTPEELPQRRGWGHSSWEQAARVAAQARVGKLILTSHDPSRSDAQVDALLKKARRIFRNTEAAAENRVW